MIFICTLLSFLFLTTLSLKEIKPKLCINCKHFITDNRSGIYGKCLLFPKEKRSAMFDLVTGAESNTEYMYCFTTRDDGENMCGREGKMYKKKYSKRNIKKQDKN
jgi:hypothetical protein